MQRTSNFVLRALVLTLSLLALSWSAQAAGMGGMADDGCMSMPGHGGMGMMMGDMQERAGKRLEQFKAQLKITPAQEALWNDFANQIKSQAEKVRSQMRDMMGKAKTAPEHMQAMLDMMRARLQAMTATQESFNKLYAALTPEQKAVADQHAEHMAAGRMQRMPKMGNMRHGNE